MNIYFESYYGASMLGDDYLEHHGVKGMHWGVRRYQNEDGSLTKAGEKRYSTDGEGHSRGYYKRSLNRADTHLSEIQYAKKKSEQRSYGLQKKADKLNAKGKGDSKKAARIQEKLNKEKETMASLNAADKEIRKQVDQSIKNAMKSGYSVHSKEYARYANEGRHWVAQGAGGLAAQVISRSLDSVVSGNKYTVSKTKEGQKQSYTHESNPNARKELARRTILRNAAVAGASATVKAGADTIRVVNGLTSPEGQQILRKAAGDLNDELKRRKRHN